jgi:hypothetical protein
MMLLSTPLFSHWSIPLRLTLGHPPTKQSHSPLCIAISTKWLDTSDQKKVISHLLAIIRDHLMLVRGLTHLFHILTVGALGRTQINLRSALQNLASPSYNSRQVTEALA